jgi:tRNA threonylcarbamoyl adenosine modification protein YeaZ
MLSTLALDTTQPEIHVALLTAGKISAEFSAKDGMIVENMLSLIELILSENNLKIEEINRIAICSGPGSYTGIRSGLSTVFGFKKALNPNLEVVSVNSIFSRSIKELAKHKIVLGHLHANKTEDYVAAYCLKKPESIFKSESEIIANSDGLIFEEIIKPTVVAKEELKNLVDKLSRSHKEDVQLFDCEQILHRKIGNIAGSLGWASFCNSPAVITNKIEPLYIKAVQALTLSERGVSVDSPC